MSDAPPPPAAASRAASLRAVFRNMGWMLGGKGVGALLSMIYIAIATRSLGLEAFGQFALVLGAVQAIELFCAFQSWQIIIRYGMPHLASGDDRALTRLVRFTVRLDIATALIGAMLAAVVVQLMRGRFGWSQDFASQAIVAAMVFNLSTHWTPIGVLRLYDRYAAATYCEAVTPLVRCLGAVFVALVHPGVIGFLAAWVLAEALTAVAYWVSALRVAGLRWRLGERLRWRDVAAANPGIARYAFATNLGSTLNLGGKQLAVLIVGLSVTPAAAGAFRLAQQLAQAMAKISTLVTRALFPELVRSRSHATGARDFETLLGRAAKLTAAGGVIVFLTLLLVGKPALELIAGREFLGAYPILLLLGAAGAIDFAAIGFGPALVALGRPGLVLRIGIVVTALMLGLMVFLAQRFDAVGAGVAILLGSLMSAPLLGWSLLRVLDRQRAGA